MAAVAIQSEQKNVAINPALNLVFFEDQALAYNYKTDQWTRLPAVSGRGFFSVQQAAKILGTIETSAVSNKDIQDSSGGAFATAVVTTGEFELHPEGGKAIVNGCRPLADMPTTTSVTVKLAVRDTLVETQDTVTGAALNARTKMANFRGGAARPVGRWVEASFTFVSTFTTVSGAEFDFEITGKV